MRRTRSSMIWKQVRTSQHHLDLMKHAQTCDPFTNILGDLPFLFTITLKKTKFDNIRREKPGRSSWSVLENWWPCQTRYRKQIRQTSTQEAIRWSSCLCCRKSLRAIPITQAIHSRDIDCLEPSLETPVDNPPDPKEGGRSRWVAYQEQLPCSGEDEILQCLK